MLIKSLLAGFTGGLKGYTQGTILREEKKRNILEELSGLADTSKGPSDFIAKAKGVAEAYGYKDTVPIMESFIQDTPEGYKLLRKPTKLEELAGTVEQLETKYGPFDEDKSTLMIRGMGLEGRAPSVRDKKKRSKTFKKGDKYFKQDYLVNAEGEEVLYGDPYPAYRPTGDKISKSRPQENAWMHKLMKQYPSEYATPEEKEEAWNFFNTNKQFLQEEGYDVDYMKTQLTAAYGVGPEPLPPPIPLSPETIKEISDVLPHYKYKRPTVERDVTDVDIKPPFVEKSTDIRERFEEDPDMSGFKLGKQTENGYEVLDRKGNLIGYYK